MPRHRATALSHWASAKVTRSNCFMAELRQRGAEGDVCLRFFDKDGDVVRTPLGERVIGMTLDQLHAVPRIVAVAGGKRKLDAIRAALLGRHVNVLITDRHTAARL